MDNWPKINYLYKNENSLLACQIFLRYPCAGVLSMSTLNKFYGISGIRMPIINQY